MTKKLCTGVTKKGKKCKNYATENSSTCRFHVKILDLECMVCWETESNEKKMVTLTCNHNICESCLEKLNMLECPMCKSKLTKLSEELMFKLSENKKSFEKELQEESFREFISNMDRESYVTIPSPAEEIIALLYFLDRLKIPLRYAPEEIVVTLNSPHMEPGRIFLSLLLEIQKKMELDMVEEEEMESQEDLSKEELFFEEENEKLKSLPRRIKVFSSFQS